MQAGEKRIDGVKRGVNKKIHPAASRSTDNGGNLKNKWIVVLESVALNL